MFKNLIFHYIIPILVPLLVLIYGIADYTGYTDKLMGRKNALHGWELLLYGNGYPNTFIEHGNPEFNPLKKLIDANTTNPEILTLIHEGYSPIVITIEGTYSQQGKVPDHWPSKILTPEGSQIMYLYDSNGDNKPDKTTWVGRASDVRLWIEESRNKERFWVITIFFSFISIWTTLAIRKQKVHEK